MSLSSLIHWWQERLFSFWLWPLNLLRDYPVRLKRVGHTWGTAVTPPFHLRKTIHLLTVQLFDLAGGPELAQMILRLLAHTTRLTAAETAVMSETIGIQMRFSDIRLAQGGVLKWVFRFNGNLAFTAWHTIFLPHAPISRSRQNLALMVHELTHVYQYEQVGSRYMTEAIYMLVITRRDCYAYGGADGLRQAHQQQKRFADFNREQQAQIVQDYFERSKREEETMPYLPYIEAVRHGRL